MPISRAIVSLGLPALLTAGGCAYTVDVYNNTRQDLVLELVQVDPLAPDWVLTSDRVTAGGHLRLGPERVSMGTVALSIVTERDRSKHIRRRVRSGNSVWDIYERQDEHGPVLELIRRDEP